ncbi:MAG TPA: hypothetical protein VFY07_05835 [Geomobilimonas sp.]|nr:hypothetical protein [Geomobilimonas sp.]
MADLLRSIPLPNGLTVRVVDHTRHYYGDFYLVRLEFSCTVSLLEAYFTDRQTFDQARTLLGEIVSYRRNVDQMGVPASAIEQVREKLIDNFIVHSLPYFATPDFPKKLVLGEMRKSLRKVTRFANPPVKTDA